MTDAPKLILPITDAQINMLVKWRKNPDPDNLIERIEDWAAHAPIEQLISAILIQQVPALVSQKRPVAAKLEHILAQLVVAVKGEAEEQAFRDSLPQQLDLAKLSDGARSLGVNGVDVLRQSEMDGTAEPSPSGGGIDLSFMTSRDQFPSTGPDFLDDQGNWDFEFTNRQHNRRNPFKRDVPLPSGQAVKMTDPQARFFNKFLSEPDESANLMSFFGGGKTFMAKEMLGVIEQYKEFNPVVLALTKTQLHGLLKRLDAPETKARTFGQLAGEILAAQNVPVHWRPGNRRDPNYFLSADETARRLRFNAVSRLAPGTVADIAMKAVRRFCRSGHDHISEWHLPTIHDRLSPIDRTALVNYAQALWNETVEPNDTDSQLPVRAYHLIKYCALRGYNAPERYTHFIIDEAHDLTTPLQQILDRSPQSVQTMGDPYQRLRGFVPRQSERIRRSEIGLTVRASNQVEDLFNTLIDKHPAQTNVALQGSRHMRTRISYYDADRSRVPKQKCTILVSDLFEMTEWFHRLRESGESFSLLPGSVHNFFTFNASLVSLYFQGIRAQSSLLFRYPTWEALREDKGRSGSFKRVEAMLSGGADRQHDFSKAMDVVTTPDKAKIILGLAEDARNTEFDCVMLAPDLLIEPGKINKAGLQAHVLSMIYVGASRARYELILPGHLEHWLEAQKQLSASGDDFD
ncbi:hypothetical protein [Marinobacter sp. F3R08]|uniref:hypothetical protein n=1 Tax=Marinobacter sp. F3R08 TaxID=2841559 RepID=UPI001C0A5A8B|nr:hypothetical protein [Marinobacter sp. F3R08]MBU2952317.1 hypothetical protein [Marinobacter sp. F3R08]